MGVLELRARPLLQQVRVDRVRPQQRHPMLPGLAFGLHGREIGDEVGFLLDQVVLGLEPVLARMRVRPEIRDEQRRPHVEAERAQGRANPRANDHGTSMPSAC